jgi:hypothetical protein
MDRISLSDFSGQVEAEAFAFKEVRVELNALVEPCRTALRDRAEEND